MKSAYTCCNDSGRSGWLRTPFSNENSIDTSCLTWSLPLPAFGLAPLGNPSGGSATAWVATIPGATLINEIRPYIACASSLPALPSARNIASAMGRVLLASARPGTGKPAFDVGGGERGSGVRCRGRGGRRRARLLRIARIARGSCAQREGVPSIPRSR